MSIGTLKLLCVFAAILCLAAALTGIQSVRSSTSGTVISHFNDVGRIWALCVAVVFAAFAFGIHIRARLTWKIGFVLPTIAYLNGAVGGVAETYRVAGSIDFVSFWLPSGLVVLLFAGTTFYWCWWWKRQRSYFYGA
jgi:hypothetical protein